VRNRRDGTVEAVFAGDAPAVDRTIASCRKSPRAGRVESFDVRDASPDELALRGLDAFTVLPTA
jgi:acylphosphatase